MVISHDRDFLDAVVKAIVHIDQRKLRRYTGDYSSFEEQRAQALVSQTLIEKQARERAHCSPSSTVSAPRRPRRARRRAA